MEFVSGGDLLTNIINAGGFFTARRAKFYACEVLLAIEFLHANNILYRYTNLDISDLKMENILLGHDGHIKLADFGICKENMSYSSVTYTFCGTSEYMAPEIFLDCPYGRPVDWWAFGVLIYLMLTGTAPFSGENLDDVYDSVLNKTPELPDTIDPTAASLVQMVFTTNAAIRKGPSLSFGKLSCWGTRNHEPCLLRRR
jgi:serine/threonine protein kinase